MKPQYACFLAVCGFSLALVSAKLAWKYLPGGWGLLFVYLFGAGIAVGLWAVREIPLL